MRILIPRRLANRREISDPERKEDVYEIRANNRRSDFRRDDLRMNFLKNGLIRIECDVIDDLYFYR